MSETVGGETRTGRRRVSSHSGRRLTSGNECFSLHVVAYVGCFCSSCTGAHTCSRQANGSFSGGRLPAPGVLPKPAGQPACSSTSPLHKCCFGCTSPSRGDQLMVTKALFLLASRDGGEHLCTASALHLGRGSLLCSRGLLCCEQGLFPSVQSAAGACTRWEGASSPVGRALRPPHAAEAGGCGI